MSEAKGISLTVKGSDAVKATLEKMGPNALAVAQKALVRAGDAIMAISIKECPRRIGNLEGSQYVEKNEEADGLSLVMGYRAAHAFWVHEMLDPTRLGNSVHWTKAGSKPKFLEDPFNRYKDEIPDYVAKAVAKSLMEEME